MVALVVAPGDGEGVQDVGGVILIEAVEDEVQGVQAGAEMAALLHVPAEGFALAPLGQGEVLQVSGGVAESFST